MTPQKRLGMAALAAFGSTIFAQEISIATPKPPPVIGALIRPFHTEKRSVSPARLTDTPRLEALVRGGNLYLSARDVIALVLENNLDIAVQRYGSFLGAEVQRRTEGGGYLRQVDTALLSGPQSVSLEGVTVGTSGLAGGVSAGGGIVSQIGPVPPSMDPSLVASVQFGHQTTPLTNTILNQTNALTNDYRQLYLQYSQQFATGTSGALTYSSTRSLLNSPTPLLNPATTGYIDLVINQNLLQGSGIAVNKRDIEVAKNNIKFNSLQLKRQVITTVSAVLNLYWDLVSFDDELRIRERALATAQKQYADNQSESRLGTLAAIEVTRAAAAVSASQEDALIAQTHVDQQEAVLKNALSRTGVENAWLDDVHIVPLDRIEVPKTEELKTTADLIQAALTARPELEQVKVNLESNRVLLKGDRNGLLPTLQAFAELTNNALSGPVNPIYNNCCGTPDALSVGGYGNLLAQMAQRKFPNYSAGVSLNIPLRNRAAQADYVTDQLQLRQNELQLQRAVNQVRVDVKTAVIGFQQSRVRYENAVNTRVLAEQTLTAEQNRFTLGATPDTTLLIQAQNNLSATQSAEVQAMANYSHAKIALDEAVGQTLDVNRISMVEAANGRVERPSFIPDTVPSSEGRPR